MISLVVFCIFYLFFNIHSFYPYTLNFKYSSKFNSYIDTSELVQHLKPPLTDQLGGTVYIDSISKNNTGSLVFTGRYYSPEAVQDEGVFSFLGAEVGPRISSFISANFCTINVDLQGANLSHQLEILLPKKKKCLEIVQSQLVKKFKISEMKITDARRTEKIVFIALIISVFFGGTLFVLLESKGMLKK